MASITKNIVKIFTGTFFSRIFGFIREIIVGAYFGTGKVADAFTFALMFPNLFRQILGEDMVERAFMPPFKTIYDKGDKKKAWKFVSVSFNWFFFSLLGIMTVLYLITPLIFMLIQHFGIDSGFDYNLAMKLIFILLPFMVFIGLAAFVGSMLNFFERNWIFGFAPIMLSIGVIGGIVFLQPVVGNYSIAIGYVIGALLQLLIQVPFIRSKKFKQETEVKYSLNFKDTDNDFSVIKRESKVISLNAVFNKSTEFFGRMLATTLASGATSSLFYANRIFQLPFAIISLPIARGINPVLNKMKATGDFSNFNKTFKKGINLYLLFFIPITVVCLTASDEIIDLILRRKAFDANSVALTADALRMYSLGLLPMSFVGYFVRVMSLVNKNIHALKVSITCAIANIILAYVLAKHTPLSHSGIALASSLSFYLNMMMMDYFTRKELKEFIDPNLRYFFVLKNLVAILLAVILVCFLNSDIFTDLNFFEGKLQAFTMLSIKSGIVGIVFYIYYIFSQRHKDTVKK